MSKLIFQIPATLRPLLYTPHRTATTDSLPRVAQPSTWTSMIPKAFRRHPNAPTEPVRTSKWKWFTSHPATPVLALSLLVGSQAINTLALKNETLAYTRVTEGKLALLKGVIERVQRGEEFDVDEVLGTGKVIEEGEWFDVIEEIEAEERIQSRNELRRERQRKMAEEQEALSQTKDETANANTQAKAKPMFL
ncbi:hypothetical protein E2P81_ATG05487 [Venturia nashicola]|uniref:Uncharacterized protein n=1 Tax=Venturia nashicola TaxID=86259 RepID=A0A4Z1P825_9PEZI|nr:hypothetical protein E6O75_ATG05621 [Venturia nashicola]TLD32511.1 hypothetical protein E2P81_ATG05487 [Venturia nashicola]